MDLDCFEFLKGREYLKILNVVKLAQTIYVKYYRDSNFIFLTENTKI